jgi:lysophospholipase
MFKILLGICLFFSFNLQAKEYYLKNYNCDDDHYIRYGFFFSESKKQPQKTLIIFLQGMKSFIEKHGETIDILNDSGYDVFSFDWRSQGGSSRYLEEDTQKIHIPSFDIWLDDLDNLLNLKEIKSYENIVFVGVSMGGHLLLRNLLERNSWMTLQVRGVIFLAPMIDLYTYNLPYSWTQLYIKYQVLKNPFDFAMGYKPYDFKEGYKDHELSTYDKNRAMTAFDISRLCPEFVTSGPTWYFMDKMLDSLETLHENQKQFNDIPSLWVIAKDDVIINNNRILEFMSNSSELRIYDDAKHNLFEEKDEVRERLFADIASFINKVMPSI